MRDNCLYFPYPEMSFSSFGIAKCSRHKLESVFPLYFEKVCVRSVVLFLRYLIGFISEDIWSWHLQIQFLSLIWSYSDIASSCISYNSMCLSNNLLVLTEHQNHQHKVVYNISLFFFQWCSIFSFWYWLFVGGDPLFFFRAVLLGSFIDFPNLLEELAFGFCFFVKFLYCLSTLYFIGFCLYFYKLLSSS